MSGRNLFVKIFFSEKWVAWCGQCPGSRGLSSSSSLVCTVRWSAWPHSGSTHPQVKSMCIPGELSPHWWPLRL
jgi:hypothetical protein